MNLPWKRPVELPHLSEDEVILHIRIKDRWGREAVVERIVEVEEKFDLTIRR